MNLNPTRPLSRWRTRLAALCGCLALTAASVHAAPSLITDHDAYAIGEPITAFFADGPGNKLDWVGVYPDGIVPGSVGSTVWRYVDGTQSGAVPYKEGKVRFPAGLNFAGDWTAFFLLNDGYTALAQTSFKVVDAGTPLVRAAKRTYAPGEAITVTFTNGPANPKDWVGLYKKGQTPGAVGSTGYLYVDGTQTGAVAAAAGSVTFLKGLSATGDWVAIFLENDGYTVLATESFAVKASAGSPPKVAAVEPVDGATNAPPAPVYKATLQSGSSPIATNSIALTLDGTKVPHSTVVQADTVLVSYSDAAVLPAGSIHKFTLTFADDSGAKATNVATFTIGDYVDIRLPAPLYLETFDAVPEGKLPAGWTAESYSTPLVDVADLGDLSSTAYQGWTVAAADRFTGTFKTYGNPDSADTDYRRVLSANPRNVVNGKAVLGPLAQGRFLFGNSGYQNGAASQVLFVTTGDHDLTGKTDVAVSFRSVYEQNQDSIGALEYSVDAGKNWLPVVYYLDGRDIVRDDAGAIDVDATFNTERGDVARFTDAAGTDRGGSYGAFIAAPISPALAPFLQARVDDDPVEGKRVELFRIAGADNQKTVRFRFAYAGTDSWYWGVDDFGIYSLATSAPLALSVAREADGVRLSWTGGGTTAVLESSPSINGPVWQAVPGVSGNAAKLGVDAVQRYFRVRQP